MSEKFRDVHTTHCCRHPHHGCKYGDEDCSVATGIYPQEGTCEQCSDDGIESLVELDAMLNIENMSVEEKRDAIRLGLEHISESLYAMSFNPNVVVEVRDRFIRMRQYLEWVSSKCENLVFWA